MRNAVQKNPSYFWIASNISESMSSQYSVLDIYDQKVALSNSSLWLIVRKESSYFQSHFCAYIDTSVTIWATKVGTCSSCLLRSSTSLRGAPRSLVRFHGTYNSILSYRPQPVWSVEDSENFRSMWTPPHLHLHIVKWLAFEHSRSGQAGVHRSSTAGN